MTPAPPSRRAGRRDCPHGGRHKHGTLTAYNKDRCGCPPCTAAKAQHRNDYSKRIYFQGGGSYVDATGTRRRIRALMRLGWSARLIASECGMRRSNALVQYTVRARVTRETAVRIGQVYDRLSMRLGPSEVTRRRAEEAGWPPPLAYDDETIDDPAVEPYVGQEDRSSTGRRLARIDEYHDLRGMGVPEIEIARRWGVSDEGMERWLYRNIRTTEEAAA